MVNSKTNLLKIDQPLYHIAALVILLFAVYGQTLFASFHFDDRSSILENPALKSRSDALKNLWD